MKASANPQANGGLAFDIDFVFAGYQRVSSFPRRMAVFGADRVQHTKYGANVRRPVAQQHNR